MTTDLSARAERPLLGRTAVVTGAGRGLGRSHALLLAARGAHVVVNDLGTDLSGAGRDPDVARAVVAEIRDAGGIAFDVCSDVTTEQGAAEAVDAALQEFGGVDIVVNNAGIDFDRPFGDTTAADYDLLWRYHTVSSINVTRAAWPTFVAQHRGRVVMTCSTVGLMGMPGRAAYAAAKGAVHGVMRVLAIEGAEHGITANSVAPVAYTRMVEPGVPDPADRELMRTSMPPELVSPVVAWLVSDGCKETGRVFSAWSGRVAEVQIGTGAGFVDTDLTVETLAAHTADVSSTADFYAPAAAWDEIGTWTTKLFAG